MSASKASEGRGFTIAVCWAAVAAVLVLDSCSPLSPVAPQTARPSVAGSASSSPPSQVATIGEEEVQAMVPMDIAAAAAFGHRDKTGSFAGFTPARAARMQPMVRYDDSPAASVGAVSIRAVTPDSLVLATRSPSGVPLCYGIDESGGKSWFLGPAGVNDSREVAHGTKDLDHMVIGVVDAQTPLECARGGYTPNS